MEVRIGVVCVVLLVFDRTQLYLGNGRKWSFPVCIWGHEFAPPPKKSSGANDVIFIFVNVLSFKC